MSRFTGENIEQFSTSSGGGKGSYFSLKNDKDVARVRFLYESASDIEGYTVHRVKVGDRERYVNCIADEGECPFCQARLPKFMKIFVPLYNEDAGQLQTWERGKQFYGKLAGLCSRYSNLVARTFDIERNGKPKDTQTTYEIYPIGDADGTTIDDILEDCELDELPNPLGTIILEKSADDMQYYLGHEEFPSEENETPIRRRGRAQEETAQDENQSTERPRRASRGNRF